MTDMYYNRYDLKGDKRTARFRGTVRRCAAVLSKQYRDRLHYIDGLGTTDTPQGLSSDGLYPSDLGHRMIAERLVGYMAERKEVN